MMLEEINREIRIKEKWWLRKPNWKIFNKLVSKKSKKKKKKKKKKEMENMTPKLRP